MENAKNKRAGIGQKPRGKQETRGFEALPEEKQVASNEGQEEGVKDPVSEPADRVQEGGGLLGENSPISDSETPLHRCILDQSFLDRSDQSRDPLHWVFFNDEERKAWPNPDAPYAVRRGGGGLRRGAIRLTSKKLHRWIFPCWQFWKKSDIGLEGFGAPHSTPDPATGD